MSGLLADFPHYFLVVPGIQSDAQFLLVVILECHWSLIVCCCCCRQSLMVVVRSQNWTWGPGAAWSSHLLLYLVLELVAFREGKYRKMQCQHLKRLGKGMLYIFTCWLDFSDVFRMGFDLESVLANSNSLGFSDSCPSCDILIQHLSQNHLDNNIRPTFAQQSLFVFLALMTMVITMMERKMITRMLLNNKYPLTFTNLKCKNN